MKSAYYKIIKLARSNYKRNFNGYPSSTMPDQGIALSTGHDIGRHPELHMSATKPDAEITVERKELAKRFQRLPPQFRPSPTYRWHNRHGPTSGTQNVCQETGSGNRKWKQRFNGKNWRFDYNGYHHIFDHARLKYNTDDMARHREPKMSTLRTGSRNNC